MSEFFIIFVLFIIYVVCIVINVLVITIIHGKNKLSLVVSGPIGSICLLVGTIYYISKSIK